MSQNSHNGPATDVPHDTRWRAAWAGNANKLNLYVAEKLDSQHRVLSEEIAGSADFKVPHLSQYVIDEEVTWYKSPQFRYTPTSNLECVTVDIVRKDMGKKIEMRELLRGGPRDQIFFNPDDTRVAIATCGGLCPGLNSVIRELTLCLHYTYGVKEVYGIRYGYEGFYKHPWMRLTPELVSSIHQAGGTILGTSRGGFDATKIVDALFEKNINQIYLIGGDGTHRGSQALYEEIRRRKLKIAVVGVPKTIDNDINMIDKSFGFDTAVEEAMKAITSVHVEAKSTTNGIGIVVLMGRQSGFIAMYAALASGEANVCLIPEVPFALDGPTGLLDAVHDRLAARGHCVIVVAEGAGGDLMKPPPGTEVERDKSGNVKLPDIGSYLKSRFKTYFAERKVEIALKFVDPSYMIRSVPANASDSVYTIVLAQNAVYGAMAGFTGFVVGLINTHYCYVPIKAVTCTRKVDVTGDMWQRVMEITGQPDFV
jgi:6-phosphofructokinase 1